MNKINKYLFLDIDGVICTRRSLCRAMAEYFGVGFNEKCWTDPSMQDVKEKQMEELYSLKIERKEKEDIPNWSMSGWPMDKIAIDNLNEIVDITNVDVILSSTWRYTEGLEGTNQILRENGFKHHLKGKTPTDLSVSHRGQEIQAWLDKNSNYRHKYVIIDDDWHDIYGYHPDNLVVTSFEIGLTQEHKEKCIEIIYQ